MIAKARKLYFNDKPLLLEWVIVALVSGIMLISFFYIDTRSLTVWSVNLLDAVSEGRIKDFYLICYINEYGAHSPICYGPFYQLIPWAIWNIPIWLIQKLAGIAIVSNPLMMIWSKLFLVLLEAIVLLFAYKITLLLTQNKIKGLWVVFLTASFPFMLIGVYYSGQSDILTIALSTVAVYELLKKNEKSFLFWSMLAVSAKAFFIFPFILLVLFTEKKIFKIFFKVIICYLPTILFQLVFANAPMYKEAAELTQAGENMDMLTRTSFGRVLMTNGSWFFLLFIVLCVIAYIINVKDESKYNSYIIYFMTASYLLLMGFTSIQHYRPIYLAPFLFIMFMLNDEWYRVNIILKTFYSFSTISALCCGNENIFARENMENTLITKFFPLVKNRYNSIYDWISYRITDYETYHKIFASISVACVVIMLVINCPLFKAKPQIECRKCERWIQWIDILVMIGLVLGVYKIYLGWFPFL